MQKNVFIFIDDSGITHKNDKYSFFGGIVFLSEEEYKKFSKEYKLHFKSINKINKFKELKYTYIKNLNNETIFNFVNKYITFGICMKNYNISSNIMSEKKSRSRFRDYCIRRIIKEIILYLFKLNYICDNNIKLNIILDSDNQKTNTNRLLSEDIYKELKIGFNNKKYNIKFMPIIKNKLYIDIKYVNSIKCHGIQAADLIVGNLRNSIIQNKKVTTNIIKYLP